MSKRVVLTVNGGSSSIKFAVFSDAPAPEQLLLGQIQRVGQPGTVISAKGLGAEVENEAIQAGDHSEAGDHLIRFLRVRLGDRIVAGIGHRVVHGGLHLLDHQIINDKVLKQLDEARALDISHLPREISMIEAFSKGFPNVLQVACFDTAFFKDLPTLAKQLPIPRKYFEKGVHRFGFHGISYSYLMQQLGKRGTESAGGRVILAHLGSGASMAAIKAGKPVDTSMSFTPLAGLMMGTRPGDLDPGLLVYLLRSDKLSADNLDDLLNKKCGLLGVSGTSNDMRDLVKRRTTDPHAAEAVDLFCYQAKKFIGSYSAAMGGVDTIVFAGGIGEHSAEARLGICSGLEFLGVEIDAELNAKHSPVISNGKVTVRIIPTNEEAMIAQTVVQLIT